MAPIRPKPTVTASNTLSGRKPRGVVRNTSKRRNRGDGYDGASSPSTSRERNSKKPELAEMIEGIPRFDMALTAATMREIAWEKTFGNRANTWYGKILNPLMRKPAHREHSLSLASAFRQGALDSTSITKGVDEAVTKRRKAKENTEDFDAANQALMKFRHTHTKELEKYGYTKNGIPKSPQAVSDTQTVEKDPRYHQGLRRYRSIQDKKWKEDHPTLAIPGQIIDYTTAQCVVQ